VQQSCFHALLASVYPFVSPPEVPRLLARDALWAVGPGLVPFEERSRDGILNFGTLLGSSWEVEECLTRPWILRCATEVVFKVFMVLIGKVP
jgi:hypothetical protein